MELAGGFQKGDRVLYQGMFATVIGRPARPAAARISVAVRYDTGEVADVRVAELESAEASRAPPPSRSPPQQMYAAPGYDDSPPPEEDRQGGYDGPQPDNEGPQQDDQDGEDGGEETQEDVVWRNLNILNDDLMALEAAARKTWEQVRTGAIPPRAAHGDLAQVEAAAKALEAQVDELPVQGIPSEQEARNAKSTILSGVDQFFSRLDAAFEELNQGPQPEAWAPPMQQQAPPSSRGGESRPATAGSAGVGGDLAGGYRKGDRVEVQGTGERGVVFGKPARAACANMSCSILFDNGTMADIRVVELVLLA